MNSIDAFLTGLIDYAGLFPPASETMSGAVRNYATYVRGADRAALGRFIVPVARLGEVEDAAADVLPRTDGASPWRFSALASGDIPAAAKEIARFNRRHLEPANGLAIVDVVELKAADRPAIVRQRRDLPAEMAAYYEIPLDADIDALVQAIGDVHARAKIRTGGVTNDAFPEGEQVIRFIATCIRARVPFKATAGLHHPLRGEFRLTYAPDSPRGMMYGYVNVFLAAALLYAGESDETALGALMECEPAAVTFEKSAVVWRGRDLTSKQIEQCRQFAISFGSCSFREPIDELSRLNVKRD